MATEEKEFFSHREHRGHRETSNKNSKPFFSIMRTLKKLIIDKSVFESTLPAPQKLLDLAHSHFIILPDILYFECATASKKKEQLLELFRNMIFNGAHICPSCREIIRNEAQTLVPYGPLVKLSEVDGVKMTFLKNPNPYSPEVAENLFQRDLDTARNLMISTNGFNVKLATDSPELLKEVRKWDNSQKSKPERLCNWASLVDSEDIHRLAVAWLSNLTDNPEQYCLSKEWFTWHFLRLVMILQLERNLQRHKGGCYGENIVEHDLQDIAYVALLSRADGLLTRDKKLVNTLAKAAFPEKDVFSDLDEVPTDYRC